MAILYYDNTGKVRASHSGDGYASGEVDASFKKFWFDESKNQGLLEMIGARILFIEDVTILNDVTLQVAGNNFPVIGKNAAETEAEAFFRNTTTFQQQMKAGLTQWATLTTNTEKQAFIVANFDKLMTILDGMLGYEKFLATILKVSRL